MDDWLSIFRDDDPYDKATVCGVLFRSIAKVLKSDRFDVDVGDLYDQVSEEARQQLDQVAPPESRQILESLLQQFSDWLEHDSRGSQDLHNETSKSRVENKAAILARFFLYAFLIQFSRGRWQHNPLASIRQRPLTFSTLMLQTLGLELTLFLRSGLFVLTASRTILETRPPFSVGCPGRGY